MATAAIIGGVALAAGGAMMSKGKKVKVPEFRQVNVGDEQRQAIQNNLSSFPQAAELSRKATQANQDVLMAMIRQQIPNYDQLVADQSRIVTEQLRAAQQGELPKDIQGMIQRSAAARSVGGGYGGSGMNRNLVARDLGLTGIQMSDRALNNASNFIAKLRSTSVVNPTDVTGMFVTPALRVQAAFQNNQSQFARDMTAAQEAAKPDPTRAAIGGLMQQVGGMAMGAGMMGGGLGFSMPQASTASTASSAAMMMQPTPSYMTQQPAWTTQQFGVNPYTR